MEARSRVIYLSVTNSLTYDQRMSRICLTLHEAGYQVVLVGIRRKDPLPDRPYKQIRLTSWFSKGKLFYLENHIRLFFFLLYRKADLLVANDLDTALPVWLVSRIRRIPRLMDAHEFFTEMKEVLARPGIHRVWSALAHFLIPRFPMGYTVSSSLSTAFKNTYGVSYAPIRNLPIKQDSVDRSEDPEPFLLYQGAVNQGRGFETLIPAMRHIPYKLVICGDGNFMDSLKLLIRQEGVEDKILLTGMIEPPELRKWALRATIGIFLPDRHGANQYFALANKFLDNLEAGLPQIIARYPEYEKINQEYAVACLLDQVDPQTVSTAVNKLMDDKGKRKAMTQACLQARDKYCWQQEKNTLLSIYQKIWAA